MKDVAFLSNLKGIGKRTAQKIIASLHGKAEDFVIAKDGRQGEFSGKGVENISVSLREIADQVTDVLLSSSSDKE